jgi:hypothetical protein
LRFTSKRCTHERGKGEKCVRSRCRDRQQKKKNGNNNNASLPLPSLLRADIDFISNLETFLKNLNARKRERGQSQRGRKQFERMTLIIVVYTTARTVYVSATTRVTVDATTLCWDPFLCFLFSVPLVCLDTKDLLHIQCEWILYYCVIPSPLVENSSFLFFLLAPCSLSFHRTAIDWRRSAASLFLTSASCSNTRSLLTRIRHFQ